MTRRLPVAVAAVALAVGGTAAYRATRPPPALRFETIPADRGPVVAKVTATGTLSALVTVQVGSQVSGRIAQLFVDFNSPVKRGQLIARIDPQLFQAAVEQSRANLVAAKGNLGKAKAQALDADRQARRARALADQKLVSDAERDTAEANAEAARAQVAASDGAVAQAQASLNQAQVNLAYTRIVSPTNGTVISRNIDLGQTVAASFQSPTLFVIAEDLARMQVDTSVAEADVGKLTAGMKAGFTVDAYPGERFDGTVRQIRNSPTTVQNVVTYDAVIDVRNPELKLRPGMTANVTFVYAERPDALRVPNAALRFRPAADVLAAGKGSAPDRGSPGATAAANGNGAGAGHANGARAQAAGREAPGQRTVYVLRGAQPVAVPLRTGVSDGTFTEVLEGDLRPGDACIVDASGGSSANAGGSRGHGPPRIL